MIKLKRLVEHALFSDAMVPASSVLLKAARRAQDVLANRRMTPTLNGEYWLVSRVPNGSTVLDCGFNNGEFTDELLKSNPKELHAFDPDRNVIALHRKRSPDSRVHFHPVALADAEGTVEFYDYGGRNGCNSLYDRRLDLPDTAPERYAVQKTTLDNWAQKHLGSGRIQLLKIDIEGAEIPALRGATNLLSNGRVDCVLFEYSTAWLASGHTLGEASSLFRNLGMNVYRLFPRFLAPLDYGVELEGTLWGMFVAIRPGVEAAWDLPIRNLRLR